MALSIDALLAVVLFVALLAVISFEPTSYVSETQPRVVANQLVDDAITAIDSTGHLMQLVESDNFPAIETKLQDLLPQSIGFRAKMSQYRSNLDQPDDQCRDKLQGQDFDTCFPNPPTELFAIGESLPSEKEIFHGRKVYVRREPGNCKIAELQAPVWESWETGPKLFFQGAEDFEFTSIVKVGGEVVTVVECDQTANVELSVATETTAREPVDIIFAAAKNKTLGECAIAAGTEFSNNNYSATSADFEKIADLVVSAAGAIDLVLSWSSCSSNCPEFYIKKGATEFGSGKASTFQNSTECNYDYDEKSTQEGRAYYYNNRTYLRYLAIGSGLMETGTWEVYVKNPNGIITYNLKAKYIQNENFDDDQTDPVKAWNEPISKINLAQVMIVEFTLRADWKATDKYAYAEIGDDTANPNTGSRIQPESGLRDAGDIGTPFLSQLKKLDAFIQDIYPPEAPAYSYALEAPNIVNETLVSEYPTHTKIAIILGDSSDESSSPYTVATAVADAQVKNIHYYTIDFSEENWGQSTCQNQDLFDLAYGTVGGECYPATDEGALQPIFDIIALEIEDQAVTNPDSTSATITMTFPADFKQIFLDNFSPVPNTWDGETLKYQNVTITTFPWVARFDMLIPCDFTDCDIYFSEEKEIQMPPATTVMDYEIGGIPQPTITWPVEETRPIELKYRDLAIAFLSGSFYGINDVTIEYQVSNQGYLDVDLTGINLPVDFYIGDGSSVCNDEPLDPATPAYAYFTNTTLYALYPGPPAGDTIATKSTDFTDSGYFCLWLNKDQTTVKECGGNNKVVVQCDIPKTFVYVLDYWAWDK